MKEKPVSKKLLEVHREKIEQIFEYLKAKMRGFYKNNYNKSTQAFHAFLEPTELTVSLL